MWHSRHSSGSYTLSTMLPFTLPWPLAIAEGRGAPPPGFMSKDDVTQSAVEPRGRDSERGLHRRALGTVCPCT